MNVAAMARDACIAASPRRVRGSGAGTAILELALLLPVLMLLLLGAIDLGRVFYENVTIATAARAGVQYGAQNTATSSNYAGMQQAALDEAQDLSGVTATATRYCECSDGTTADCTTGRCSGKAPIMHVRVTVQKTFSVLFPYPGVPSPVALSHVAVMRVR